VIAKPIADVVSVAQVRHVDSLRQPICVVLGFVDLPACARRDADVARDSARDELTRGVTRDLAERIGV